MVSNARSDQTVDGRDRSRVTVLARSAAARRIRNSWRDPRARSDRDSGGKLIDLRERFQERARSVAPASPAASSPAAAAESEPFSAAQERAVTEAVLGHRRHGLHL